MFKLLNISILTDKHYFLVFFLCFFKMFYDSKQLKTNALLVFVLALHKTKTHRFYDVQKKRLVNAIIKNTNLKNRNVSSVLSNAIDLNQEEFEEYIKENKNLFESKGG